LQAIGTGLNMVAVHNGLHRKLVTCSRAGKGDFAG
jgi:hypothetical protein